MSNTPHFDEYERLRLRRQAISNQQAVGRTLRTDITVGTVDVHPDWGTRYENGGLPIRDNNVSYQNVTMMYDNPTTYQYRNRVTRRYFDVIGTDVVVSVQLQRSSDEGWTWKDCSPTLSVPSEM